MLRALATDSPSPCPFPLPPPGQAAPYNPPMAGVISLLEGADLERVESLWEVMEREFGVPGGFPGGVPHLSYHLGNYDKHSPAFEAIERLARAVPPFRVRAGGIGIFTGAVPILYLPIVRSPELAATHAAVTDALRKAGIERNHPYYEPAVWQPHVTLAQQNLAPEALPGVVAWLAERSGLAWEIAITNLALAVETPDSATILARYPLG